MTANRTTDVTKQAWKFQEAAVYLALQACVKDPTTVRWNHDKKSTPKGMSIDPDLVVGKDKDKPDSVIFVTHASAERAGEKKFWRTVPEVIECKRLSSHPRVINILFAGNIKPQLKVAYGQLFDALLDLQASAAGKSLSKDLVALTRQHGTKPPDSCLAILAKAISSAGAPWIGFLSYIKHAYAAKPGNYHATMTASSFQSACVLPSERTTSLRRSVCKLVTLPKDARNALYKGDMPSTVPAHTLYLKWFDEDLSGDIIFHSDAEGQELADYLDGCDKADAEYLVEKAKKDLPSFVGFAQKLREIGNRGKCYEWLADNLSQLASPTEMQKALEQVYTDPSVPLKGYLPGNACPSDHWLFDCIMMLLRAETGRSDGYGYSKLGEETGYTNEISALAGTTIAPYLQRKKDLSDGLLSAIAKVFAGHLKRLGKDRCVNLTIKTIAITCASIFRFQMMNYRLFNPIDWVIEKEFKARGIDCDLNSTHDSFLSAHTSGAATSTKNIIRCSGGRVWIKCQSGYDGKVDKRKELCGRIGAMKLCSSPSELAKLKYFLVIDGFFDATDIKLFQKAGWDGIFYYDEMDRLANAVQAATLGKLIPIPRIPKQLAATKAIKKGLPKKPKVN